MSLVIYNNLSGPEVFTLNNYNGGSDVSLADYSSKKVIILSFIKKEEANDCTWLNTQMKNIYSGASSDVQLIAVVYKNAGTDVDDGDIDDILTGPFSEIPILKDKDWDTTGCIAKVYKNGFTPSDFTTTPFTYILYYDGANFRVVDKFHMGSTDNGGGLLLNAAGTAPTLSETEDFINSRINNHLDTPTVLNVRVNPHLNK